MVNYNTAHSDAAYKYIFKTIYNKTSKKRYNSQICQHNVCNTNIIVMKDIIILEKTKEKKMLSKGIANTIAPVKVAQVFSPIDFAKRYNSAMSNTNQDATKKLGLTNIKKY